MFLLAVHCCEGCFLKAGWKEEGGTFKQGRLKPGITSWKEVQGRGHCTWPLSSLVLQMYVQSGFLTFGRFTLEFCRHRILTDTLILPTGVGSNRICVTFILQKGYFMYIQTIIKCNKDIFEKVSVSCDRKFSDIAVGLGWMRRLGTTSLHNSLTINVAHIKKNIYIFFKFKLKNFFASFNFHFLATGTRVVIEVKVIRIDYSNQNRLL